MDSKLAKRKKAQRIIASLKELYPAAKCSLDFTTPFELLIATILAAQCTDERINKVTPQLFQVYPDIPSLARAQLADVEYCLRSVNFYRNKAKAIIQCAQKISKDYQGIVPQNLDNLITLPGVGRKTANVVLGVAFMLPAVVVDTHVTRLTHRLGLTENTHPTKIEIDLQALLAAQDQVLFSHLLVFHGRAVCKARKPSCNTCTLQSDCLFYASQGTSL